MLKAFSYIRQFDGINLTGKILSTKNFLRTSYYFTLSYYKDDSVLKYSPWLPSKMFDRSNNLKNCTKCYFSSGEIQLGSLSRNEFEIICNETLESLCEYFEMLVEDCEHLKGCDITYSDGVLTVNFGNEFGTYVINRQAPNRQIWLSSPTSGPKRYDYVPTKKQWIYRHDNKSLHELLQQEIPKIIQDEVNFFECAYARR